VAAGRFQHFESGPLQGGRNQFANSIVVLNVHDRIWHHSTSARLKVFERGDTNA
jgi:hypothetical protein